MCYNLVIFFSVGIIRNVNAIINKQVEYRIDKENRYKHIELE